MSEVVFTVDIIAHGDELPRPLNKMSKFQCTKRIYNEEVQTFLRKIHKQGDIKELDPNRTVYCFYGSGTWVFC
jgi:hypothetical protein